MKYFINRIHYSFYCMDVWAVSKIKMAISPLLYLLGCFLYCINSKLKEKYGNKEIYMKEAYRNVDFVAKDLDIGSCEREASAWTILLFVPYILLLMSISMHFWVCIVKSWFLYMWVLSSFISYMITFVTSLKGDVYKRYFKQFARDNDNVKWNILTIALSIGSIASTLYLITIW